MELREELEKYASILNESKKQKETLCKDCECDPCACETMNESLYDAWKTAPVKSIKPGTKAFRVLKIMSDGQERSRVDMLRAAGLDPNPISANGFAGSELIDAKLYKAGFLEITQEKPWKDKVSSWKVFKISPAGIQALKVASGTMNESSSEVHGEGTCEKCGGEYSQGKRCSCFKKVNESIENGDRVKVKGEGDEIFKVSQCDERRCWIGDRDGRGWFISLDRLKKVGGKKLREFKEECDHAWNLVPSDKTKMKCKLCKETKPVEKRTKVKESDDQGNPYREKSKEFLDWETGKTDTCPGCKKEPCECKKVTPKKVKESTNICEWCQGEPLQKESCPECFGSGKKIVEEKAECQGCGKKFDIKKNTDYCPKCSKTDKDIHNVYPKKFGNINENNSAFGPMAASSNSYKESKPYHETEKFQRLAPSEQDKYWSKRDANGNLLKKKGPFAKKKIKEGVDETMPDEEPYCLDCDHRPCVCDKKDSKKKVSEERIAATVAKKKQENPDAFCKDKKCLYRTKEEYCPKHKKKITEGEEKGVWKRNKFGGDLDYYLGGWKTASAWQQGNIWFGMGDGGTKKKCRTEIEAKQYAEKMAPANLERIRREHPKANVNEERIAATVAKKKHEHPEQFCKDKKCLYRTKEDYCPKHKKNSNEVK